MIAATLALSALIGLSDVPMAAQDKPAKKTPAPPAPVALTGCVVRGEASPTQYTMRDVETGEAHRLTGLNLRGFVGQRVEVLGNVPDSKRLQIKTGLLPNSNVAAQGGIDPVQGATAAAGGSAPVGDVQLPEFRVKSVRPLSGGCG